MSFKELDLALEEEEGEPWPKRRIREGVFREEEEEDGDCLMRCCLMGEEERLVEGEEETREVRREVWGVLMSRGPGWKAGAKKEEENVEADRRGMKRSA